MPFEIFDGKTYTYALIISTCLSWSYCLTTVCLQTIVADLFINAGACYRDAQALFKDIDQIFGIKKRQRKQNIDEIMEHFKDFFEYHQKIFM